MTAEGRQAPDFELPGIHEGQRRRIQLSECVDGGGVLLAFYPCDFSPLCTDKLCTLRDVEWFEFQDALTVLGISQDSLYAHAEFASRHDIPFPLLSDTDGTVTSRYGIRYDSWEGQPGLPRRAFILVDASQTVRYLDVAAEATEVPNLDPLLDAVRAVTNSDTI